MSLKPIWMPILNLTPNSFSDGGKLDSFEKVRDQLRRIPDNAWVDFGAESTAPMNSSVSEAEEWQRIEKNLLPNRSELRRFAGVSLDTYKEEVFVEFARRFRKTNSNSLLVWNDVSGCFPSSLNEYVREFSPFKYIYCHNLAPERDLAGSHMDFLSELKGEPFLQEVRHHFESVTRSQNVLFDLCFGFSKTRDQNRYLLQNIRHFMNWFPETSFVLGVSRKSFFRIPAGSRFDQAQSHLSEIQQFQVIESLRPHFKRLVVRSHENYWCSLL